MKTLSAVLMMVGLMAFLGCNQTPPGGPGATDKGKNGVRVTTGENSFRVSLPSGSTTVKQGEDKNVTISISRGKNFDQDVKLSLSGMPKGVSTSPLSPVIKHGDKDVTISIKAAPEAALGEHTITVTATPTTGEPTSGEFKIDVKKP
jgi:uncharacterized membrane protein